MDDKETGRVEAFSDGVFAVAITLLVLNIHGLPEPQKVLPDSGLLKTILLGQLPTYLAFVTSFATVGVMWMNHHRLFTHIKRVDTGLFALNLLLLLVIVFIPFPTALLASYITHPEYHYAALLYSATNIILALSFYLLWSYASHDNRLLDVKAEKESVDAITDQYRYGPLFYVITFILAFIYVPASIGAALILAIFFALPGRRKQPISKD